jgi:hypothetical protein
MRAQREHWVLPPELIDQRPVVALRKLPRDISIAQATKLVLVEIAHEVPHELRSRVRGWKYAVDGKQREDVTAIRVFRHDGHTGSYSHRRLSAIGHASPADGQRNSPTGDCSVRYARWRSGQLVEGDTGSVLSLVRVGRSASRRYLRRAGAHHAFFDNSMCLPALRLCVVQSALH